MKLFFAFVLSLFVLQSSAQDQTERFEAMTIGFYNLENLFDTLDTENKNDKEFTPEGRNKWNSEKYTHKLKQMSSVIAEMGTTIHPDGLAILGVAEIENQAVLEDLVKEESISARNYQIAFEEGPDRRGIDVGLLYNPKYFELEAWKSFTLHMEDSTFKTRDQLLVTGQLMGERVHVIVAHWPSRSGGQKRSEPNRIAAAELGRQIADSILNSEPEAAIIYMGDLNDDPVNKSVTKHFKSSGDIAFANKDKFFSPMYNLYKKGVGSNAWRDTWNLFDQIMLSPGLLKQNGQEWQYHTTRVYNKPHLANESGNYKGYPFRSFAGGAWAGGYSDHFPVYVILKRRAE